MRSVELTVDSGDDLDVRSFHVIEAMSAAFHVEALARMRDDAIELEKLVGKPASFSLRGELGARTWTGVCAHIAQTAVEPRGLSTYALRIVPTLWLLTHRRATASSRTCPCPTSRRRSSASGASSRRSARGELPGAASGRSTERATSTS